MSKISNSCHLLGDFLPTLASRCCCFNVQCTSSAARPAPWIQNTKYSARSVLAKKLFVSTLLQSGTKLVDGVFDGPRFEVNLNCKDPGPLAITNDIWGVVQDRVADVAVAPLCLSATTTLVEAHSSFPHLEPLGSQVLGYRVDSWGDVPNPCVPFHKTEDVKGNVELLCSQRKVLQGRDVKCVRSATIVSIVDFLQVQHVVIVKANTDRLSTPRGNLRMAVSSVESQRCEPRFWWRTRRGRASALHFTTQLRWRMFEGTIWEESRITAWQCITRCTLPTTNTWRCLGWQRWRRLLVPNNLRLWWVFSWRPSWWRWWWSNARRLSWRWCGRASTPRRSVEPGVWWVLVLKEGVVSPLPLRLWNSVVRIVSSYSFCNRGLFSFDNFTNCKGTLEDTIVTGRQVVNLSIPVNQQCVPSPYTSTVFRLWLSPDFVSKLKRIRGISSRCGTASTLRPDLYQPWGWCCSSCWSNQLPNSTSINTICRWRLLLRCWDPWQVLHHWPCWSSLSDPFFQCHWTWSSRCRWRWWSSTMDFLRCPPTGLTGSSSLPSPPPLLNNWLFWSSPCHWCGTASTLGCWWNGWRLPPPRENRRRGRPPWTWSTCVFFNWCRWWIIRLAWGQHNRLFTQKLPSSHHLSRIRCGRASTHRVFNFNFYFHWSLFFFLNGFRLVASQRIVPIVVIKQLVEVLVWSFFEWDSPRSANTPVGTVKILGFVIRLLLKFLIYVFSSSSPSLSSPRSLRRGRASSLSSLGCSARCGRAGSLGRSSGSIWWSKGTFRLDVSRSSSASHESPRTTGLFNKQLVFQPKTTYGW